MRQRHFGRRLTTDDWHKGRASHCIKVVYILIHTGGDIHTDIFSHGKAILFTCDNLVLTHNTCTCLCQQTPLNSPPERQGPGHPHLGTVESLQITKSIATCILFAVNTTELPHKTTVLHTILLQEKQLRIKID